MERVSGHRVSRAEGGGDLPAALRPLYGDVGEYSRVLLPRQRLRGYQMPVARAIAEAVLLGRGGMFCVVFSRQAGKDETLAQLLAWLLTRFEREGGSIVVGAPTLSPQAAISRDRLVSRLELSALTKGRVSSGDGEVRVGNASARFMSTAKEANSRGATASLLLVANEAQDIDPAIWDARFEPMGASTNSVTVFLGTVWDDQGLLHRQMEYLGRTRPDRVYLVPWRRVAEELPAYGDRVRARIEQFGDQHPYIKTEYELVPLTGEAGLFPAGRRAQLQGEHPRQHRAAPGSRYVLLIDVAGEEETDPGPESYDLGARRDSTVLTAVEILGRGGGNLPEYRVVDRRAWTGVRHTSLLPQLVDLARNVWRAMHVVVDATGVGAGLASFLAGELSSRRGGVRAIPVEPFIFSLSSKSRLGYDLLGLIDSGRIKTYAAEADDDLAAAFAAELAGCRYEILPGPGKLMRWGVPAPGHDDLLLSFALAGHLDQLDLRSRSARGAAPSE